MMSPAAMEAFGGTVDPMQEIEAAHQTAAVLVHAGRSAHDPTVTARLVDLVEELGLSTVADLSAHRPARTFPGALGGCMCSASGFAGRLTRPASTTAPGSGSRTSTMPWPGRRTRRARRRC